MKINFDEVFAYHSDRSEDVEFVCSFAKEQQEKGDLSDTEIMKQCLEHLASQSNAELTRRIVELNKQVSVGIEGLSKFNKWSNLKHVARHALKAAITVQEREHIHSDEATHARWVLATKMQLEVLNTGYVNFGDVLTPKFMKKHGWVNKEQQ
jgi:hypothetical protein